MTDGVEEAKPSTSGKAGEAEAQQEPSPLDKISASACLAVLPPGHARPFPFPSQTQTHMPVQVLFLRSSSTAT